MNPVKEFLTMTRQLPVLALGLITVAIISILLIGAISYVVIDFKTRPSQSAPIPQLNSQPARTLPANAASPRTTLLSADEVKAVVEATTGQKVTWIELERARGITAYEVRAGGLELFVDAFTGEIIYQKSDD
jgi:uncharacterized membrane protein YkoI